MLMALKNRIFEGKLKVLFQNNNTNITTALLMGAVSIEILNFRKENKQMVT